MVKKKYIKPSMEVYDMKPSQIICSSPFDTNYIPNLPTIPGQPEDEKHLA